MPGSDGRETAHRIGDGGGALIHERFRNNRSAALEEWVKGEMGDMAELTIKPLLGNDKEWSIVCCPPSVPTKIMTGDHMGGVRKVSCDSTALMLYDCNSMSVASPRCSMMKFLAQKAGETTWTEMGRTSAYSMPPPGMDDFFCVGMMIEQQREINRCVCEMRGIIDFTANDASDALPEVPDGFLASCLRRCSGFPEDFLCKMAAGDPWVASEILAYGAPGYRGLVREAMRDPGSALRVVQARPDIRDRQMELAAAGITTGREER